MRDEYAIRSRFNAQTMAMNMEMMMLEEGKTAGRCWDELAFNHLRLKIRREELAWVLEEEPTC